MANNRYELYLTIHARERMKERSISFKQIKNVIDYGKQIGTTKSKYDNVYVVYQKIYNGKKNKIVVITTYTTNDFILSDYQESLWLQLYNLVDTCTNYLEILNQIKIIETKFAIDNTNNGIVFRDFLLYYEPIILYDYDNDNDNNNSTIKNPLSHTLLSYALIKGNICMVKCLIQNYDINPYIKIYSDYSILCETFRKLYSVVDFPEASNQAELYSEPLIASLTYLSEIYPQEHFIQEINKRNDNYSLLHRSLYNGLDKLSNWLILNGSNISLDSNNLTKYHESILDLIARLYNKLGSTWKTIKQIHNLQDTDIIKPKTNPIYNNSNIPYSDWKIESKTNKANERKELTKNMQIKNI